MVGGLVGNQMVCERLLDEGEGTVGGVDEDGAHPPKPTCLMTCTVWATVLGSRGALPPAGSAVSGSS